MVRKPAVNLLFGLIFIGLLPFFAACREREAITTDEYERMKRELLNEADTKT